MAVELIQFLKVTSADAGGHRVYAKARWSDPWTLQPWLWCTQASWAAAPTIPTAELAWRSGFIMRPGEMLPDLEVPQSGVLRWFIKIEIDAQLQKVGSETIIIGDPLLWYGTLEMILTNRGGVRQVTIQGATYSVVTAEQSLVCYGLAEILNRDYLRHALWRTSTGVEKRIERPIVFNAPDAAGHVQGNRATTKNPDRYLFTHKLLEQDKLWSTRDIVEYLAFEGSPRDKTDTVRIRMRLDSALADQLPDWDKPIIDPHQKTVWDLLNEAMPRGRMLGFFLDVYSPGSSSPDEIRVKPFSMLGAALTIPEADGPGTPSGTLAANTRQRRLDFDSIPHARAALKESELQAVDRVRLRGARRTSTCTLSYLESSLEIGWPSALETEYEAGASGSGAAYTNLMTDEKQKANAEARGADKLFPVFRRLRIPETWNMKQRDGEAAGDAHWVFPLAGKETEVASSGESFPVYNRELYVLPYTPLLDGYDYSVIASGGTPDFRLPPIKLAEGPFNHLPPFAVFKVPETTGPSTRRWVNSEKIAEAAAQVNRSTAAANRRLNVRIDVPRHDRAIILDVNGAPQHAVFPVEFTPLAVDRDTYGGWNWQSAMYTVSLADDRYCEGVYPPDTSIDPNLEHVRELFVHLGDDFRQDWLVPKAVIGLDPKTGQPLRCDGGGWINSDHFLLKARARLAYEYYSRTRRALEFSTSWVTGKIQIGDFIDEIGDTDKITVESVVTQITVSIPHGDGDLPPPVMHITTAYVELEAMRATFAHTTREHGRMHGRMR